MGRKRNHRVWISVSMSSDGSKIIAAADSDKLFLSDDGGLTWVERDSSRNWVGVAMSKDGSKFVAAVYAGQIYTS